MTYALGPRMPDDDFEQFINVEVKRMLDEGEEPPEDIAEKVQMVRELRAEIEATRRAVGD